ncbi:MAG TPA: IPT/TIG domain-containing protein [Terriglobales bacterium]|nr:IPT/TIG domain-containing protein [Terriglobales bacterium]
MPFTVLHGYVGGRMEMTPFSYPPDYSQINLSDPEVLDWVHWGLSGASGVDRKSGANLISGLTVIGAEAPTQYASCADHFSWTNGNVNTNVVDACSGLFLQSVGDGFQITVPADTTPKTLKLYVATDHGSGRLQASLSDSSAVPYSDSSMLTGGDAGGTYSIDFESASAGQTLTVVYTLTVAGDITIEAAELTPKHPNVAITQPSTGQSFTAPASFTASVQASQIGSTIGSVSLLQDGNSLLTLNNSPFDFQVSNLAAGNYEFSASAADSSGLAQASSPVALHVVGSGGELAASVAVPPSTVDLTQQGTADWVLYGRQEFGAENPVNLDRKGNVSPLIAAASRINWAFWYQYGDNLVTYTAEDATQSFGPQTTGIYSPNPASGFQFTISAGLTERTANIYVGAWQAQGKLEAYLSDGSAPVYIDTSTDTTDHINHVYTIKYHAASEGQHLIIRYTLLTNHAFGNVTLQAVTVDGAPRQAPSITSVSQAADPRGTLIWIYGAKFGTTSGTVLFNGAPAQVLYWSDTAIEVSVPPGATSGPIVVSTDGASSNGLNFTVTHATPPGPPATIAPSQVSLFVGDTRKFQVLDSSGRPTTASSWTSSDTTIADFGPDPDDPTGTPILTAKASGQVTINADSATATVTVYPQGTSFPAGTVLWSVPSASAGGGSGAFSVQAMPAPSSLADLLIVQPSGLVQALKADGTPVWNASFGFNAAHALPDANGGIIGFTDGSTPMTRIDSSGKPTWSIPPTDYHFWSWNISIHPDGTIFILGTLKQPPDNAQTTTYVIGIDGLTGGEKFRVPVASPNEPAASTITIAPDGDAYLEHILETTSQTQQNTDVTTIIDSTSAASLRIMKIGPDGTYADSEIQNWSSTYHEEDDFSDSGATEVATYSYSPAPLPLFSLKEIIPDNHGNLLASWSYAVPGWTQTCTTINRHSQQQSTTCSGEVPGQDSQAHVGLLIGTTLQNDFTLSGVNEFTGPMVMGEGDTAFATVYGSDNLNRIVAFNAATGAALWSTPATSDELSPILALAGDGIMIGQTSGSSPSTITRYDGGGNSTPDLVAGYSPQYLRAGGLLLTLDTSGLFTAYADAAVNLARSDWDQPGGNGARTAPTEWPQLVRCSDGVTSECAQHSWTVATGGPRDWIFNGLYALERLLGTPCVRNSSDPAEIQACNISDYVFTSQVKDANGNQGYGTALLGFLLASPPQFYDATLSTLIKCGWIESCSGSAEVKDDFLLDPFDASTVIFDSRQRPTIPPMRTFFNPNIIWREFQNVSGPHDADNMAMVFHEALHAYTRLPDFPDILNLAGPSLKKELQCSLDPEKGTYDVTAFLMQFTNTTPPAVVQGCTSFANATRPTVPPQ